MAKQKVPNKDPLRSDLIGIYINKHDEKEYEISYTKVKNSIVYHFQCINSTVKNIKYEIDIPYIERLLLIGHFLKKI